MTFDVGTLSGVLGVVLTVLFFVVGYRQTVGAKKERASAANKEILDVLSRRFVLERDFQMEFEELNKFLSGKGIEHKIGISDIFSLGEFECALIARIIESDYVDPENRRAIIIRINNSFKVIPKDNIRFNRRIILNKAKSTNKNLWILGATSGVMSIMISVLLTIIKSNYNGNGVEQEKIGSLILLIFLSVTATAFMIVIYSRMRERTISVLSDGEARLRDMDLLFLEKRVVDRLSNAGFSVHNGQVVDYVIIHDESRIGLEIVRSLNSRSLSRDKIGMLYNVDRLNELIYIVKEVQKFDMKNAPNMVKIAGFDNFMEIIRDCMNSTRVP